MKNSWQILTIFLAASLLVLSIKITTMDNSANSAAAVDIEKVGIDLIMTRSSVRSYTSQPVETDKVETILKAGMAAPTAGNRQPWDLVVVTDREILDTFPKIIGGASMAARAQCAIVVCGTPAQALLPDYWIQDCSAVTENILLAAHSLGLGAVWCGAFPNNEADRVGQIWEQLCCSFITHSLLVN